MKKRYDKSKKTKTLRDFMYYKSHEFPYLRQDREELEESIEMIIGDRKEAEDFVTILPYMMVRELLSLPPEYLIAYLSQCQLQFEPVQKRHEVMVSRYYTRPKKNAPMDEEPKVYWDSPVYIKWREKWYENVEKEELLKGWLVEGTDFMVHKRFTTPVSAWDVSSSQGLGCFDLAFPKREQAVMLAIQLSLWDVDWQKQKISENFRDTQLRHFYREIKGKDISTKTDKKNIRAALKFSLKNDDFARFYKRKPSHPGIEGKDFFSHFPSGILAHPDVLLEKPDFDAIIASHWNKEFAQPKSPFVYGKEYYIIKRAISKSFGRKSLLSALEVYHVITRNSYRGPVFQTRKRPLDARGEKQPGRIIRLDGVDWVWTGELRMFYRKGSRWTVKG